jgi:hypothetical protein
LQKQKEYDRILVEIIEAPFTGVKGSVLKTLAFFFIQKQTASPVAIAHLVKDSANRFATFKAVELIITDLIINANFWHKKTVQHLPLTLLLYTITPFL